MTDTSQHVLYEKGTLVQEEKCKGLKDMEHLMRLHLRLHLHVENLQIVTSLKRDDLGNGIHDGRLGRDGPALRLSWACHIDDNNLYLTIHLLSDANVFLALHRERGE